jgi:SP family sugar:H+ symporter-like MFS transporter
MRYSFPSSILADYFSFSTGFVTPYLLSSSTVQLEMQIGWVYAPVCFLALLFVFFFVPECKGKSLEEVDWLFQNKVPVRKFRTYVVPNLYDIHAEKGPHEPTVTLVEPSKM